MAAQPAQRRERDVLIDAQVHDQPLLAAILRNQAIPAAMAARGESAGRRRPLTVTVPGVRRSMPKMARATSLRPAPTRPARATISPRRTVNDTSVEHARSTEALDLETVSPGVVSGLGEQGVEFPADHRADDVVDGEVLDRRFSHEARRRA